MKAHWRAAAAAAIAGVLLGPAPVAAAADESRRVIYVQPLGRELPKADVDAVVEALVGFYGLTVRVLPRLELPRAAFYPPRARYRAEKLLDFLTPRLPADGARILGLTAVDISTTKDEFTDWGVLGLGDMTGSAGIISTFRCRRRARGAAHARVRLAKVAVHEIGHTLGLPHCPTVGCIMEDARGLVTTTDREYDLCPRCRARLAADGNSIPEPPQIPWPKP